MSTRRALAVLAAALTAVLVAAGLGLAGPTSADPGERASRPVRTTITASDRFDSASFVVTIRGKVNASDRRCVRGRLVKVRGFQPVTGAPFVIGTDRASRRGAYTVSYSLLAVQSDGRYSASVARLRTAGPRSVTCTAATAGNGPAGR